MNKKVLLLFPSLQGRTGNFMNYRRQGLAGSWSKDTVRSLHFGVFTTFDFTPTALSSDWKVHISRHTHFFVPQRGACSFFVTNGGSQLTFRTKTEKVLISRHTFFVANGGSQLTFKTQLEKVPFLVTLFVSQMGGPS